MSKRQIQEFAAAGRKSNNDSSAHRPPKKRVSIHDFREDPLYPRIQRAVAKILAKSKVVAPVDVLIAMDILTPEKLEDWRRGRIPYLERVILGNLSRFSRLLRILRMHAHDLKLVPTETIYKRWGKGPKQQLRFTKTGDPPLEAAYSRHFVWPGKGPFHMPGEKPPRPPRADADQPEESPHIQSRTMPHPHPSESQS